MQQVTAQTTPQAWPQMVHSEALRHFQRRLLRLHPGGFQPDGYLLRWCPPPVAELLERYAMGLRPKRIIHVEGHYGTLECHRNALHYATLHQGSSPWWGFGLYEEPQIGYLWWVHSVCLDEDGTLIDSAPPSSPSHFVGIPWGRELFRLLAKPSANLTALPPVLQRSLFSVLC